MNIIKEYTVQGKSYKMRLFDSIKDGNEAYLIGYLLGDGGFNQATHKRQARLFVSSVNENVILNIQELFIPDTPINNRIPKNKTRPEIKSNKFSYKIQFPSKFYNTFNKFGLMDVKDKRTYHNIPKEYMSDFLLGLFDADGHISWGRRRDRNRLWCNFGITHPNVFMLTKLQRFLVDELRVPSYINPRKTENVFDLKLSKRDDIIIIFDYMYNNSTTSMYNEEKKQSYLNFKKEYI